MGKSGFKGGNLHAQNLQAGSISTVLAGSGTDTTSVSFPKSMEGIPKVQVTATSNKDVRTYVSAKSKSGFTLNMISSTLTGTVTFDYHAYDDAYR